MTKPEIQTPSLQSLADQIVTLKTERDAAQNALRDAYRFLTEYAAFIATLTGEPYSEPAHSSLLARISRALEGKL